MQIDIKLLEKCPELSDYEESLIISVDVEGERQVNVAKSRALAAFMNKNGMKH